jgi:hypothetical protein
MVCCTSGLTPFMSTTAALPRVNSSVIGVGLSERNSAAASGSSLLTTAHFVLLRDEAISCSTSLMEYSLIAPSRRSFISWFTAS